jgi:DNA-binding transcriptional LysR family regulator
MDRLTGLRVFREIVETGSFSRAAERLGLSAPMASKHLAQLESRAGARLLNRSSRHLSPTEAGELYYAQCRQALDILDAADAAIQRDAATPRGRLKLTAPDWCANPRFAQALADYRDAFPEVIVDLRLENRKVDLVTEGLDLALRASLDPAPTLFARLLCVVPFHAVASSDYLARVGVAADATRLAGLDLIVPSYLSPEKLAHMRAATARTAMRSDNSALTYQAVLAGIGVAVLPDWIVADDIASGRLKVLRINPAPPDIPLHAVYVSRRQVAPKLRSFIDFFARRFGGEERRALLPQARASNVSGGRRSGYEPQPGEE